MHCFFHCEEKNVLTNPGVSGILPMQLAKTNYQESQVIRMNLMTAEEGKEYIIRDIVTDDEEMEAFLFSLGCYSGEPITVVSRRKRGCVVSIKDARYSIDNQLAGAIVV